MAFPLTEAITPDVTTGHAGMHVDLHHLLNKAGSGLVNSQSGTTYTFVIDDKGKLVESTNAASTVFTVPTNASVAFAVGTRIYLLQYGTGALSVAAAGGVTIRTPATLVARAQYAQMVLLKRATDEWVLGGDLQ